MYCSITNIEKKRIPTDTLIQLTDDDDRGFVDSRIVNGCISDATVLIDAYLRGRYAVPLDPIPDLATSICADLAIYGLYCLRPSFDIPESVKDRRTTALALLCRIQDGKMKLYEDAPAPPGARSAVSISGPVRLFNRDGMGGF